MVKIPLTHPLKRGNSEISELVLQDIRIGHMLAADDHKPNSLAATLALLSSLSTVPELILRTIHPEDWPAIRVELNLAQARFHDASRAVMAAVLALDLDESDMSELVSAWAMANERKLDDVLMAIADREAAKDPLKETAETF